MFREKDLAGTERAAAVAASFAAVVCHFLVLFHAGPLWRNEVNTINVASLPTWAQLWHNLQFDSFPLLWFLVLRFWIACGLGSDLALRILGCAVGLATLATVWIAARRLRLGVPWFLLALFALNPVVIVHGDSVRAYGIGLLTFILAMICFWEVVARPSITAIILAEGSALLAVHSSYQNSALVCALVISSTFVAVRQQRWRIAAAFVIMGGTAALSMLPYVSVIREAAGWNEIIRMSRFDFGWFAAKLTDALGFPFTIVWLALATLILGCGIALLARTRLDEQQTDALLFAFSLLLVAPLLFYWFLNSLRYFTESWYYAPLFAVVALGLDLITSRLILTHQWRIARLLLFTAIATATIAAGMRELRTRRTNVDRAAAQIAQRAAAGDIVIANEWYHAITLHRYAPDLRLLTIPSIGMPAVHRYDLVNHEMQNPMTAWDSTRAVIERTLRAGRNVWIVGEVPRAGQTPVEISAAPGASTGWLNGPYYQVWSNQLGDYLAQNATRLESVTIERKHVSQFEDVALTVGSGWRTR